jgi:oxygen-independent coproporphyrinogen III oxidase
MLDQIPGNLDKAASMSVSYPFVYTHFPFCDVICHYCDFYTARTKEADQSRFFEALKQEATIFLETHKPKLKALYMGGGTPSVSPLIELEKYLALFLPYLEPDAEVTLEANPNNIHPLSLSSWKSMGINRISLGVQSLEDKTLKRLGRTHSASEAQEAIRKIRAVFENTSADLIYGVPDTNLDSCVLDAKKLVDLGLNHISAYHLTLEPKHFLFSKLPKDEFAAEQILQLSDFLQKLGFDHYEFSNFAKPGFSSKNNSNYWRGGAYYALGPSAHGYDGKKTRWKNISDWQSYINKIHGDSSAVDSVEDLSLEQLQIERLFTSLRTKEGIDLARWKLDFGFMLEERRASILKKLEEEGLASLSKDRIVLTLKGRMLADEIVKKLL